MCNATQTKARGENKTDNGKQAIQVESKRRHIDEFLVINVGLSYYSTLPPADKNSL
jgi:hypothetical protein